MRQNLDVFKSEWLWVPHDEHFWVPAKIMNDEKARQRMVIRV